MVRPPEEGTDVHTYWYARLLGIYRVFASMTHPDVWVRL